ncbi:V-type ATP synthase subunit E family protein [Vagococcus elongatus]|uniref:ATPase V n=1 Tax=Vagococcus elongatus TaxID=180344 RepID=A0A430ARA9_9ENTE|nr:V-type ATP synthase subunit E [Vagococcus elongatus]RSU10544.1 hypothetical protein CBF29_09640 [Vagococcus elongatus]
MEAIERIIQQIEKESHAKMEAYKQERLSEMQDEFEREKRKEEKNITEQIHKNLNKINRDTKLMLERQRIQRRQKVLTKKQDLLDELFEALTERMNQWGQKEFQEFMEGILPKIPISGEAEIILGEYSKGLITSDWLGQFRSLDRVYTLSVDEQVDRQGGFVVRQGKIEYNFLFSSLVEELKEKEGFYVSQQLFQQGD